MTNNEEKTMNNETALASEQAVRSDAVVYGSEACDYNCGGCDGGSDDWMEDIPTGGSSEECCGDCCGNSGSEILGIKIRYNGSSSTDKVLKVGQQLNYKATFYPYGATEVPLFWRCSDYSIVQIENHPTFHNTVVLTAKRDGVVRISLHTAADGVETDSCTITVDSREEVVVEDQDDHFTVTFVEQESTNGKVWKSVCCDVDEEYAGAHIWETDDAYLDTIARNIKYNCTQAYTPQQLALLYRLDPLGVAYYVNQYLELNWRQEDEESYFNFLGRKLNFKDQVYRAIFKVTPGRFYFLPTDNGLLAYGNYEGVNRWEVFSEAEFLFGKHTISQFNWFDFIKGCLEEVFELLMPNLSEVWGAAKTCQALFAASAVDGVVSSASQQVLKEYVDATYGESEDITEDALESAWGRILKPVKLLLGIMKSAFSAWDLITLPEVNMYKSFNTLPYRIVFKSGVKALLLQEIIDLCENR